MAMWQTLLLVGVGMGPLAVLASGGEDACAGGCPADDLALLQIGTKKARGPELSAQQVAVSALKAAAPKADPLLTRPNQGKAKDVIEFGVFFKAMYGLDFVAKTFQADVVTTLHWTDTRAATLIPTGSKNVSIPADAAAKKMWLPSVAVTNRAIGGLNEISSMVSVATGGKITKVDRVQATIKNDFDVTPFPFDKQTLRVRIASTSLMSDQLVMKPLADPKYNGVADGVFKGMWLFDSVAQDVFEDSDGQMKKSRGELIITVYRDYWSVLQSLVMPAILIVTTSFLGFFIPVNQPPFLMPRIATSFVSLLAQVNLSIKFDSLQPSHGIISWMDAFEEYCVMLIYSAVLMNIVIVYAQYRLKVTELPAQMDREVRNVFACLCAAGFLYFALFAGSSKIWILSLLARVTMASGILGYIFLHVMRLKRKQDPAAQEGPK